MSNFTQQDRETLIRLDERMNNHLAHHEKFERRLIQILIAMSTCVLGIIGKAVVTWLMG